MGEYYPNCVAFFKFVNRSEITGGYSIINRCSYKGYIFQIIMESDDKILIHTCDNEVYKKFQFDMREPGMYQKWIQIKESDKIWTEKRSIGGYSIP